MKATFSLIVLAMLFLVSCSKEETENETDQLNFTSSATITGKAAGGICEPGYVFPVIDPKVDTLYNIIWIIEYADHLTPEEIYCVRYEYFTQHGLAVKLCLLQPTDPNIECWALIPGWPSQTTSTTIDDDPRLTANNNSGG